MTAVTLLAALGQSQCERQSKDKRLGMAKVLQAMAGEGGDERARAEERLSKSVVKGRKLNRSRGLYSHAVNCIMSV